MCNLNEQYYRRTSSTIPEEMLTKKTSVVHSVHIVAGVKVTDISTLLYT